ncbi:MAG: NUDIX hydrolase [Chloroflexi bacterium]|nr:NUDIX hydrolase [Chloroflexota bacterium]
MSDAAAFDRPEWAGVPRDPSGYLDPGRPGHCARCGALTEEIVHGGLPRPVCPVCGWVYYAKNATGAALLIVEDGKALLVQRAHEPYLGQWMLPAGFVEYGELAEETAVREAQEETGLDVELTGLWGLYFGSDDPRNVAHLAVYAARRVGGTLAAGDDAMDARFFGPDDLPAEIAFRAHRRALADWRTDPGRTPLPLSGRGE